MRLLVLQPYLPGYRVPLFDAVSAICVAEGGQLRVMHGKPRGDQAARRDSAAGPWSVHRERHEVRTPWGVGYWRALGKLASSADVIVAELDAGNIDAWRLSM